MEQSVKERLILYMRVKKISQKKFETAANLSNGYINSLRHSPSATKLQSILCAFPDINRTWLLTGEGEMLNEPNLTLATLPDNESAEEYFVTTNGTRYLKRDDGQLLMEVNVVPIAALGSPDDEFATINADYPDEKLLVEVDSVHHGRYFAFHVQGDSMDDGSRRSFENGDTVIVRELDRDDWRPHLHLKDWPYWVVCWGNCVRLKEITKQEGDIITLHSLNPSPEYTDFTLDLNHVYRLFNVVQVQPKIQVWK